MFEKATRTKLRFEHKGQLSVEDLWDLSLTDLDKLFGKIEAQREQTQSKSLLKQTTTADKVLTLQSDIVRHVVGVKLQEQEARKGAAERKMKKDRLAEIIARKKESQLEEMSVEDLEKMMENV